MMPDIGEIKKRRKLVGMTQIQLASASGVSQSMIAKIESGKVSPAYHIVSKLMESLDNVADKDIVVVKDIMTTKLIFLRPKDNVEKAINIMNKNGFSQIPIIDKGYPVGVVTEKIVFDSISNEKDVKALLDKTVYDVMEDSLPTIREDESLESVSTLLRRNPAVLVVKKGKVVGIVTKSDIFKIVKKKKS